MYIDFISLVLFVEERQKIQQGKCSIHTHGGQSLHSFLTDGSGTMLELYDKWFGSVHSQAMDSIKFSQFVSSQKQQSNLLSTALKMCFRHFPLTIQCFTDHHQQNYILCKSHLSFLVDYLSYCHPFVRLYLIITLVLYKYCIFIMISNPRLFAMQDIV